MAGKGQSVEKFRSDRTCGGSVLIWLIDVGGKSGTETPEVCLQDAEIIAKGLMDLGLVKSNQTKRYFSWTDVSS